MNEPLDSLSEHLQEWRVHPTPDPLFRSRVWQRIEHPAPANWTAYLRAHRFGWSAAAVMMVALASFAGHAAAEARMESDREAIVVTYLTELDPRVHAALRP